MQYKDILEKALDSICVLTENNEIEYANPAFLTMTGYGLEEVIGRDFSMVLPQEIGSIHKDLIQKYVHNHKSESSVLGKLRKLELIHKTGESIPIELMAFEVASSNEKRLFAGIMRDLREREFLSAEYNRLMYDMDKLGYIDELTHLPNHKYISTRLESLLSSHKNMKESIFAMIDVDGLDFINNKYGREAGDTILKKVGSEFRMGIRLKDILGRTENVDYSCIFPESSLSEVINLIDNLRAQLAKKRGIVPSEPNYSVSVSIGITRIVNPTKSILEYLSEARQALKKAKSEGKNKLFIHGFY